LHSITFEYHRYFTRKYHIHADTIYSHAYIHTYIHTLIQTVRDTSINNAHAHLVFNLLHMLDTDLHQTHLVNSRFIFPCCCCCCCCCCWRHISFPFEGSTSRAQEVVSVIHREQCGKDLGRCRAAESEGPAAAIAQGEGER